VKTEYAFPYQVQEGSAIRHTSKGNDKYPPLPVPALNLAALQESTQK